MTAKQMLIDYLREHGYDGLCNTAGDCGCSVDDLEPCGCINIEDCVAAFHKKCVDCNTEFCDALEVGDGEGCYYDAENGDD